jgi:hypothetical protein
MVKKKAVEIAGIALAVTVGILIVGTHKGGSLRTMLELDGFVATVRGSWLWLALSAVGFAEAALLAFGVVGH